MPIINMCRNIKDTTELILKYVYMKIYIHTASIFSLCYLSIKSNFIGFLNVILFAEIIIEITLFLQVYGYQLIR